MPKADCQKCGLPVPLPLLTEHIKTCDVIDDIVIEERETDMQECPVCTQIFPTDFIEAHASACGESASAGNEEMHASTISEEEAAIPGTSGGDRDRDGGWFTIADPAKAIAQCVENHLSLHKEENPLQLSMDIRSSPTEQDMALISFYKPPNVEWGRPLNCRLEANADETRLFEGEPGHLVPSASHFLVESDLFMVAGRMLGHSFLHGGPSLSGLSPAVVHVLLGGSPETATLTLEDCPDLDIREIIRLLGGESTLSEKDAASVQELAYAWDLPSITETNRRWIFEKLLIHAVIGRVTRQIKQLRRGLKETPMWTVLTQRPDTVDRLLPKEGSGNINPEVLLQRITWPREDDEDADYSVATICCITGYLRQFIAHATPTELTDLVKFWTGWEILPRSLSVEVVTGRYPTASTWFEALRVPGHYKDYTSFKTAVLASISSCQTGFGLV
ncbi:unnamed protein product [Arctogadus glacialis]